MKVRPDIFILSFRKIRRQSPLFIARDCHILKESRPGLQIPPEDLHHVEAHQKSPKLQDEIKG